MYGVHFVYRYLQKFHFPGTFHSSLLKAEAGLRINLFMSWLRC